MSETMPDTAVQSKPSADRALLRTIVGVVASDKGDKTIKVVVNYQTKHAKYGKYLVRHVSYKAHDEASACGIGDRVRIAETRPMSKEKRWRVVETLEKAQVI